MVSRPDRAFRIADRRFSIFDGTGAFLKGGRWNSPGRRVIYASETYPGAVLEVLAHTRIGKVPRTHEWIEIAIPPSTSIEHVSPENLKGWNASDSVIARQFGDEWLRQQRALILIVPSLPASGLARNVLINQDHPEFTQLKASAPQSVVWDSRLFVG
jgi:RES domain-containing protein